MTTHTTTRKPSGRAFAALLLGTAVLAGTAGCSNTGTGALTGAGLGAGAGAIIGSLTGSAGKGAVIGAVTGAVAGGVIGNQNERNERYHTRWDR
jgi:hypothetical protein